MKLDAWLQEEPPLVERLRLVERLAQAVDETNRRREPLGALEPGRIEVDSDQECDLKAARRGAVAAPYAAPERLEGAPPSAESDIYSAGAIAWELIAGRPCGDPPEHLATACRDVARELADAVMACLERSPEWRPKDLSYVAELARAAQETAARSGPARGAARRQSTSRAASTARPAATRERRGPKPPDSRGLYVALVGVLLVGAAVAFYTLSPFGRSGAGAPPTAPPVRPSTLAPTTVPAPAATASPAPRAAATAAPAPAVVRPTPPPSTPVAVATPTPQPQPTRPPAVAVATPAVKPPTTTPPPQTAPVTAPPAAPPRAAAPVETPPQPAAVPPPVAQPPASQAQPAQPPPGPAPATAPPAQPTVAQRPPATATALSPLTAKRAGRVLFDLHGTGLHDGLRASIVAVREAPRGIAIVRQRVMSDTLVNVLVEIDAAAPTGAFAIVLEDATGRQTKPLTFNVVR